MSRRRQEELEFEELQRRKKRRLEESRRRREGQASPAHATPEKVRRKKKKAEPEKPPASVNKKKSIVTGIQALASILFFISLFILNMLPVTYLIAVGVLLLILVGAVSLALRIRRKKRTYVKVISLALSCILLIGTFYIFKGYMVLDEISANNQVSDVQVKEESFVVYISGIDVYGEVTAESRSDVNMLAVVNPNTHQILLVTTPRDYYIELPGISEGELDKLTHAGIHGIDASMAALSQLYEVGIDFNVRVNFTSMIDIVDSLGGIDVNSELAFTTSSDAGCVVDIQEGKNHLNGEQALAFSRERKNLADGDNQRGKNQQAVITAMLRKMISPTIVISANSILNSVKENAETNMGKSQIQGAVKMYLSGGSKWSIKSMAAEGTADSRYCYSYSGGPLSVVIPDDTSLANIKAEIDAVVNGDVLTGAEAL